MRSDQRASPGSAAAESSAFAGNGGAFQHRSAALDIFDSLPGRTLGDYQIIELIAAGTNGTVYRARDLRVGRLVAIKVLPAALAADVDSVRRFHREASCLSALSHPNLITLFELEEVQGILFFVMEHVNGSTLASLLPRTGFPLERALDYARQIVAGLAAAHDQGIIHRDLKLSNLLVAENGTIKIADFGLAKVMNAGFGLTDHTRNGLILGTVDYMSPEQVRGEEVDARSDIFSFGVVLWELLTGVRPFHRPSSPETWAAILKEPPESGEFLIPEPVCEILLRCLQKEPAQRFRNARELVEALTKIPVNPKGAKFERRRFGRPGVVMLGLVFGLGLSGWSGYRLFYVSSSQDSAIPAVQFDRGIDAENKAEATKCFDGSDARCDLKMAAAQLRTAATVFDGILQTHPHHLASLWHSALAWSNLCEVAYRVDDALGARQACDRAITQFKKALAPGQTYSGLPNSVPDQARIRFNLGLALNLRARLPRVDDAQRTDDFSAAMAQFDQLLNGETPSDLLKKRRQEIQENWKIAADGRAELLRAARSRGR